MGMIGSFPKEVELDAILARTGAIFDRLEPAGTKAPARVVTPKDLPAPAPSPSGNVRIVDYPGTNAQAPGPVVFYWPAHIEMDSRERFLLGLFLSNTAGDPSTNLYKLFVDTKTRQIDVGAKGVFSGTSSDQGNPVYIGLSDVAAENLTDEKLVAVRAAIQKELARIAAFADGSAELAEFNSRVANRVTETRRALSKFVNSPPGFGFRGSSSGWMEQLDELARAGGFRRSVTMKSDLAWVEGLLAGKKNLWRDYVAKWKLVDATPFAGAARANASLISDDERERGERAAAEVARLRASYKVDSDVEAIRRFRTEYDAKTAELDALAKNSPTPRFLDTPPMTLDDQLDYRVTKVAGQVPLVASTFDNMTSATTGLALRLDGVAREDLVYASLLPGLLTQVGVVEDGKPVSYEEMAERLRKEILGLNATFSTNARTGRVELVVRGSGNTAEESERALRWMKLVLSSPDWRPENLARIRDVVDQTYGGLRRTMQSPEENWVNDPSRAWWRQENALLLATSSFLTRTHFAFRLRWLLRDAGADREALAAFLDGLERQGATAKRAELAAMLAAAEKPEALAKLPESARGLALEAVKDLEQTLQDLPDETLAADWAYVVRTIRTDLLTSPAEALAGLERVRREAARAGNARLFVIASRATQTRLEPGIAALVGGLAPGASAAPKGPRERTIEARLAERSGGAKPVFVGLLNPNTRGGVFMNSAPSITYGTTDREALLRYLASKLYAGGGAHGIFMKTWGAGLAYSNGIGGSPSAGRINYYAERCPELPQTLGFVIAELKRVERDPALVEYAVAQALNEFRSASSYEGRGEAMASDLADGVAPERVREFRKAVLALRNDPKLVDALYERMPAVYAQVLPGWSNGAGGVDGGVYYVVGPEKQLELYEGYLKTAVAPDTRLYRLYPRDYWLVR
jgi:hypothetical protein